MTKLKRTTFHGAVLLLALCSTSLALGAVNVDLQVQNGALEVTGNNAQCSDGPIDCIEVKPGTQPHLFFSLEDACSSSANYKLTKFRIAEREKQWPSSENPLSAQIADDFCADANTGYIDFMACNNDLKDKKMKIKDHNRSVTSVYYEVTAANCSNPEQEIYLDPRIKNGGGN
jgi:hypothetical protein